MKKNKILTLQKTLLIASLTLLPACLLMESKAKPKTQNIQNRAAPAESISKLILAAQFFSSALDESLQNPAVLKIKYCNIMQEDISMYSMQVKVMIDKWISKKEYSALGLVEDCHSRCLCDIHIQIGENSGSKKIVKRAIKFKSKENTTLCLKRLGDFCKSALFSELSANVKENSP